MPICCHKNFRYIIEYIQLYKQSIDSLPLSTHICTQRAFISTFIYSFSFFFLSVHLLSIQHMAYINFFLNFLLSFLSCKNCINNCFLADDLHITTAQEVEQGGMHTSQVQSNTNECALRFDSLKGQDSEKNRFG